VHATCRRIVITVRALDAVIDRPVANATADGGKRAPRGRHVRALDAWLPARAEAAWLPSTQGPDLVATAGDASLRSRLAEIDKASANLVTAIETGTDPL
jgi:hypothetical protein